MKQPHRFPLAPRVGRRGRVRAALPFLGPAFVAAIAYVDPGNFATNIAGGAQFGYLLLWVILAANLMAMLIQFLSAKVGIATGRSLPELCREHFPRPVSWGLWVQAEIIAMATDLAEFVGAAIALNLLFGMPLLPAGLVTAVVAFALLALQSRGYRRFELVIAGMLGVILLGFLVDALLVPHDAAGIASGFIPGFAGTDSLLLATGILGATVMPHVIYLHSALAAPHPGEQRRRAARLMSFQRRRDDRDGRRRRDQHVDADHRRVAVRGHRNRLDRGRPRRLRRDGRARRRAGVRARPAGVRLRGLERRHLRRPGGDAGLHQPHDPARAAALVTMAPALVVLAVGLDPSRALVLSQVVLSFGIPFALVPLVLLTRRRSIMGALVNRPVTTGAATVVATLIIALNGFLLIQTFA